MSGQEELERKRAGAAREDAKLDQENKKLDRKDGLIDFDFVEFLWYLLRNVKVVAAFVLVGILVASMYAFVIATPIYESTAQLYVVNSKDSVVNLSDLQIGSYLTSDYQLVFKTWEVNQEVIVNLDLPYSVRELQSMLTVTNPSNTRALFITVASSNAKEAAAIANEFAMVASEYIADTMLTETPSMLSVALEPLYPVRPQKTLILAIGMMASLILAVGVLFVTYMRDDKIKSSADIVKYTGDFPLAVIPLTASGSEKRAKRW